MGNVRKMLKCSHVMYLNMKTFKGKLCEKCSSYPTNFPNQKFHNTLQPQRRNPLIRVKIWLRSPENPTSTRNFVITHVLHGLIFQLGTWQIFGHTLASKPNLPSQQRFKRFNTFSVLRGNYLGPNSNNLKFFWEGRRYCNSKV